ncbi:autoinducer binding domain-containing protein [Alteromonas sp. 5E99-2]|uniref:autoinducer binding domain-containing protein n=1 Tax=Alteromonas sp. 5E99-2 TaxID=2817683 RepID=UPI001A9825A7|nr:autoinducer binding domain-containing protein [Alteromonas sp. 5E99-2]MBO1256372.1 autoinducer binding domain-containing protein [Alteromonas sp. 5E99-2]
MDVHISALFFQIIQELSHSSNDIDLFKHLRSATEYLEFNYWAYGVQLAHPVSKPTFILKNNYPKAWQSKYIDSNYINIDPTVKHGLNTSLPFAWTPKQTGKQKAFWEDAQSFGLQSGWAQSANLKPNTTGMLTISRNDKSAISPFHSCHLLLLSSTFQAAYTEIQLPKIDKHCVIKLTPRETEILKWCCDGKTSDETALILSISKRTVNFHIANLITKLDVTNKAAAAVKAIQLHLL